MRRPYADHVSTRARAGERLSPARPPPTVVRRKRRGAASGTDAQRRDQSHLLVRVALGQLAGDRRSGVRALLKACAALSEEIRGAADTGSHCAQLAGEAWASAMARERGKDELVRSVVEEKGRV